ncbi:MAG: FecR family protein [Methylomonas sp.]|nr:FecR family protein [Methylomonas sp.]
MKNLQTPVEKQSARDQAVDWWIKIRDEAADRDTLELFNLWMDQSPEHREAFAETEQIFKAFVQEAAQSAPIAPGRTARSNDRRRRISSIWSKAGLAAAACWLLVIHAWLPSSYSIIGRISSDYHTEIGENRKVVLADGSELLLDSNSAIRVDYSEHSRRVELLYGQARFNVARDAVRSFDVAAGQATIRALGTVFDVYFANGHARVVVEQHAVNVMADPASVDGLQVKVEEGQQLTYGDGMPFDLPEQVDLEQARAWQQQKMVVTNRSLADVLAELGRYRSGRIFVADPGVGQLRISGAFSLADPQQTMHKICMALNLQTVDLGPWVIVRR